MEANEFIGTEAPVVLSDIANVEQEYGFILPQDYKEHIMRFNGGRPRKRIFIESRPDGQMAARKVSDLYSFRYGKPNFERSYELLSDQLHPDLLPFGDEAGGDVFVMSVGPEDYGSVYYVAHESYVPPAFLEDEELEARPREYGEGVYYLAPSFTAFLEGLVDMSVA